MKAKAQAIVGNYASLAMALVAGAVVLGAALAPPSPAGRSEEGKISKVEEFKVQELKAEGAAGNKDAAKFKPTDGEVNSPLQSPPPPRVRPVSEAGKSFPPELTVGELHVTIKEWDVPTKGAHPHDPAVGMDGALWFTEQMQNKIGRVEPSTGAFKEFPLKVDNSGPHGLVSDSDGNIWFTGNFAHYIGRLDPKTGEVKEYKMPDPKAEDPHTAAFDGDGILWFTVQVGNFVGRLEPRSGKIDLVKVPTANAHPYGMQVNSQGVPFFCEFFTNKMASIDPKTLAIQEYPLPEGVRPRRMAIDDHDLVYFTDFERGHLGRLNPKTGEVKMWDSPGGAKSQPYGIAITPDRMVWYSESGVQPNTLVRFDPKTEAMARTNIPSGGGTVRNMAATVDGRVYIACSGVNKVGVVIPTR